MLAPIAKETLSDSHLLVEERNTTCQIYPEPDAFVITPATLLEHYVLSQVHW
jgi:hypothetical protein